MGNTEKKLKEVENPENKKKSIFLNEVLKEIGKMNKLQENIDELITKVEEEGLLYKEHVSKIPDQESQYAKEEILNLESFENDVKVVKLKYEEEVERLNQLKLKSEKANVDINLDELRKMQTEQDDELDEIDNKIKSLEVSDRKKELIRDISQDLGKAKFDISKA